MKNEIYDLFKEFGTNTITVSDFRIIVDGCLVSNIRLADNGDVQIWSGNPDTDKYAEELIVSDAERRRVFEEVLENV